MKESIYLSNFNINTYYLCIKIHIIKVYNTCIYIHIVLSNAVVSFIIPVIFQHCPLDSCLAQKPQFKFVSTKLLLMTDLN